MLRFALHHTVRGFAQHDSSRLECVTHLGNAALGYQEAQVSRNLPLSALQAAARFSKIQDMMSWASPAALAGKPMHGPMKPGGQADRVLKAAGKS
jgi:hypothetical protein